MKKLLIPLLGLLTLLIAISAIIYIFIKVDSISHIGKCADVQGSWDPTTNTCER